MPETRKKDRAAVYYFGTKSLSVGAVNEEVDLESLLSTRGSIRPARYLWVESDLSITMRLNKNTADEITLETATAKSFDDLLSIKKLFFTHTGASSSSGDATVEIFAC